MNSSDSLLQHSQESQDLAPAEPLADAPDPSMSEYYQIKQELLRVTLILTAGIFIAVWIFYSLTVALNYFIGACVGIIYLRMLAKDVESLGDQKSNLSKARFIPFIGIFVVATQWQQLQLLPIFLGFLTYKAALMVYVLRITLLPSSSAR